MLADTGHHRRRARGISCCGKGATMSTLHFHHTTTSTPEQFIAALTDLGPGRSKLFGNSADNYLEVHHRGSSDADVTEGSGGIWERLHLATPTPSRDGPTARPTSMPTLSVKART